MSSSPSLVLVPGAFGTTAGYDKLLPYLTEAGFSTHPGPYPSCNPPDPATATAPKDIASLRENVLLTLIEQEKKDIVVIAHSYGGVVAGGAAKGLDKVTRQAQGQAGGIIGLIYVAGNITLEGEALLDAMGGAYPPFLKADKVCLSVNVYELVKGPVTNARRSLAIQGLCSPRAGHGHPLQRLRPCSRRRAGEQDAAPCHAGVRDQVYGTGLGGQGVRWEEGVRAHAGGLLQPLVCAGQLDGKDQGRVGCRGLQDGTHAL